VPDVVFTTAYDQYAVKAFEMNALDYLVKPLRDERFSKTIEKVKIELTKG
jgi:two-component system LytT family response regulator